MPTQIQKITWRTCYWMVRHAESSPLSENHSSRTSGLQGTNSVHQMGSDFIFSSLARGSRSEKPLVSPLTQSLPGAADPKLTQ